MAKRQVSSDFVHNAWIQGYVAALANLDRGHDIGSMAEEALEELGIYTISDFKKHGIEDYDIQILKKHLPSVRDRRDRKKKRK